MPAKKSPAAAAKVADEVEKFGAYTVNSPLRFNGDRYRPGDLIELSAEECAGLLDAGLVSPLKAE